MLKVKPSTKEQLVYYMLQHISLGTYDNKFLTSLHDNLVSHKNPITTNQSDLLTKITLRYFKQFKKQEIDVNEMVDLPWSTVPVQSLPQYTDAFCTVEDNTLLIRSPYNAEFITEIRKMAVTPHWNKETKTWSMPYCEITAKHAIQSVSKNYNVVNFCPILTDVINKFAEYETATCWDPTYVKVNETYLIAGINKHLAEQIENLTLDVSPSTLASLSSLGIEISNDVMLDACNVLSNTTEGHKLIDFATSNSSIVNEFEIDLLAHFIIETKNDFVLIVDTYKEKKREHTKKLHDLLKAANVNVVLTSRGEKIDVDLAPYKLPLVVNSSLWGMGSFSKIAKCKTVFLGNSTPLDIK